MEIPREFTIARNDRPVYYFPPKSLQDEDEEQSEEEIEKGEVPSLDQIEQVDEKENQYLHEADTMA